MQHGHIANSLQYIFIKCRYLSKMALKVFNYFVDLFLLTMGVTENANYKKFEIPFFIVYFGLIVIDTFGMIVGFALTPDIIEKAIQFSQITTQLNCISMMLYFKFSMKLVRKLISKLRQNQSYWLEAEQVMEDFMRTVILKVFIAYYAAIFITVAPLFVAQLKTNEISEKYSYVTPFWYSCGTVEDSVFKIFCWKVETPFVLLMSNIAQAFMYYCTLHALVMLLLFYTVLTNNVRIHAEILTKKSSKMEQESEQFAKLVSGWDEQWRLREMKIFDEMFLKKFDLMLKHQQFIRVFANEVTELVHWMVMINMTGIFCALSMTAFFTIVEKTNDSFLASKMASMSIVMSVTLFIYCFNAQQISDLNSTIMNGMLDIPWHQQSIKFRKKYVIALSLNQVQVNVKACGMFEVNLRLFQSFMRAIYSVLNVLLLNLK